jgi:hypothetical protein
MALTIKVSGWLLQKLEKVEASKFGQMVTFTKDTGNKIKQMAKVDLFIAKVVFLLGIGKTTKLKAMVFILTLMVESMKDSLRRISSMDMVLRRGLMERSIEEVTLMVKCRVKVILFWLTRVNTLVISSTITSMVVVFTAGLMAEPTTVNGRTS